MRMPRADQKKRAASLLRDIRQMVRIGQYQDVPTLGVWQEEVGARIAELRKLSDDYALILSPADRLQLVNLRTEYHDVLGQEREARECIEHAVMPGIGRFLERVINVPGTPSSSSAPRAEPDTPYARWIRQV